MSVVLSLEGSGELEESSAYSLGGSSVEVETSMGIDSDGSA